MKFWGKHVLLNLRGCNLARISSARNIEAFSKTLVEKIDMVAYGVPQLVHFGVEDKKGFTLVQLIETSNITGHFCESTNEAYLDVFSCKDFDRKVVKNIALEYFEPCAIYSRSILRGPPKLKENKKCKGVEVELEMYANLDGYKVRS